MKLSRTHICILSLAVLGAIGFGYSSKKANEPLFKEPPLFAGTPAFPAVTPEGTSPGTGYASKQDETAKALGMAVPGPAPAPAAQPSPAVAQPVASYTPKVKSVSRSVALAEAAKGNWYSSIVAEVEGWRGKAYRDNLGLAIGFGWNIGQQSRARNTELATGIGMSSADAAELARYSGIQQPTSFPNVQITPEQGSQAVMLMREQYEAPMRKLVPSFASLKKNEQDALVYHAYKVGGGGAAKYRSMLSALKTYSANPTEENKLKVADTFTYKYTLNGKEYTDARSKLYLAALFTSPEAYMYLLGTKPAPADFNQVAQLAKQKIDTSKPAEAQVQDDFGNAKEELMKKGLPFNIILKDESPSRPRSNGAVFFGI